MIGNGSGSNGRADGPPSEAARDRLAAAVGRDVAELRVRLEEAGLRAEALAALGRPDAAADALDEQRALIAEFERLVQRSISAAVVERDAEQVVADAFAESVGDRSTGQERSRNPVLSGAASAVALLALVAAVLVPTLDDNGRGSLDAVGAADEGATALSPSDTPSMRRLSPDAPRSDPRDEPAVEAQAAPTTAADRSGRVPDESEGPDDPSPSPTGLVALVDGLLEAVTGLGEDADATLPEDVDEVEVSGDSTPSPEATSSEEATESQEGDDSDPEQRRLFRSYSDGDEEAAEDAG